MAHACNARTQTHIMYALSPNVYAHILWVFFLQKPPKFQHKVEDETDSIPDPMWGSRGWSAFAYASVWEAHAHSQRSSDGERRGPGPPSGGGCGQRMRAFTSQWCQTAKHIIKTINGLSNYSEESKVDGDGDDDNVHADDVKKKPSQRPQQHLAVAAQLAATFLRNIVINFCIVLGYTHRGTHYARHSRWLSTSKKTVVELYIWNFTSWSTLRVRSQTHANCLLYSHTVTHKNKRNHHQPTNPKDTRKKHVPDFIIDSVFFLSEGNQIRYIF